MIMPKPTITDKHTVGCIIQFTNKFLLLERVKDDKWGSIAGTVEDYDKDYSSAIKREIMQELSLKVTPQFFKTTYHKYGDENVAYHIFSHILTTNEYNSIQLLQKEIKSKGLFTLNEAIELNLFEDEDYCLKLYHDNNKNNATNSKI